MKWMMGQQQKADHETMKTDMEDCKHNAMILTYYNHDEIGKSLPN